jgi:hypothetical protein
VRRTRHYGTKLGPYEIVSLLGAVSFVQDIQLDRIRESSSNPRRAFDEGKLRDLAENIKLHGVLQAILVGPSPDAAEGTFELVAEARRFRASKLAGRNTIPAGVRDLTDAECREIQLIELSVVGNTFLRCKGFGHVAYMQTTCRQRLP